MRVNIVVSPNAKKESVEKTGESDYKVRVNTPAREGRANARVIELIAEHFKVSKSSIRIIRGLNGRRKIIEVN
jgi:uncharacterized protein (TIGR00251 family)